MIDLLPIRLRASVLVSQDTFFQPVKPVIQSHKDIQELLDYEQPWFLKLEPMHRIVIRVSDYLPKEAKTAFVEDFWRFQGDLSQISDPQKKLVLKNPQSLLCQLSLIQEFLDELHHEQRVLLANKDHDHLNQAKQVILSLYEEHLFFILALAMRDASLLRSKQKLTKYEGQLLNLIFNKPVHLLTNRQANELLRKADQFLWGVMVKRGRNGSLKKKPWTKEIEELALELLTKSDHSRSRRYQELQRVLLNARQTKKLACALLKAYKLSQVDWQVVYDTFKSTFTVSHKEGDTGRVRIPEHLNRPLLDTLAVLAHEIEGHVLRTINKKNTLRYRLKIVDILNGMGVSSEAVAVQVETQARLAMTKRRRNDMGYYFVLLKEKHSGKSFKGCFKTFLELYAHRVFAISFNELLSDRTKYDQAVSYVLPRTLRIFRRIPLNSTSKIITDSRQLIYLEQEIVYKKLAHKGLEAWLHIGGITMHTMRLFQQLGIINLDHIQFPKHIVMKKWWPILEKSLKSGENINQAIREL